MAEIRIHDDHHFTPGLSRSHHHVTGNTMAAVGSDKANRRTPRPLLGFCASGVRRAAICDENLEAVAAASQCVGEPREQRINVVRLVESRNDDANAG